MNMTVPSYTNALESTGRFHCDTFISISETMPAK